LDLSEKDNIEKDLNKQSEALDQEMNKIKQDQEAL
jgi:hypothetical protein